MQLVALTTMKMMPSQVCNNVMLTWLLYVLLVPAYSLPLNRFIFYLRITVKVKTRSLRLIPSRDPDTQYVQTTFKFHVLDIKFEISI
jgi:hypothetical protein